MIRLQRYWPLAALILVSICAAFALSYQTNQAENLHTFMHFFMGFFLCVFALLKLFNPKKFAEGFSRYDLLAKRSRAYALAYPLIELLLGLLYFSFILPVLTYFLTVIVMGFGAIGVVRALKEGLDINCPCMGSVLDVPISTVTLTEDVVMVLMALVMLLGIA